MMAPRLSWKPPGETLQAITLLPKRRLVIFSQVAAALAPSTGPPARRVWDSGRGVPCGCADTRSAKNWPDRRSLVAAAGWGPRGAAAPARVRRRYAAFRAGRTIPECGRRAPALCRLHTA